MAITEGKEILTGAVVAACGVLAFAYATGTNSKRELPGYDIITRFDRTDGLRDTAQVRMAGLPVGRIAKVTLDNQFRAVVTLRLAPDVKVPTDSAAVIHTDGLLGDKFIELQPGGDETFVKPGGVLTYTQGSVIIEDLLEKIVAQAKSKRAAARAAQEPAPSEEKEAEK